MDETLLRAFAIVNAGCARASIRAAGMQAKNMELFMKGKAPMYLEDDFAKVIQEENIGDNDVTSMLS